MLDRQADTAETLTELVERARRGDEAAWRTLVLRLERVVWKTVNVCCSEAEIRDDAFAATWLRLAEHLDRIVDPERLPGWLVTTSTNEVRHLLRQRSRRTRPIPSDRSAPDALFSDLFTDSDDNATLDEIDRDMLRLEAAQAVRAAFNDLDEECRTLLAILVVDPEGSYRRASETLGVPIGSLGPTRRRCLDKLRHHPSIRLLLELT